MKALSEGDESHLVHSPFFPASMFSGNRVTPLPWLRGSCVIGEPGKGKGKKTRGLMIGESRKRVSPIAPMWNYRGSPKPEAGKPCKHGVPKPGNRANAADRHTGKPMPRAIAIPREDGAFRGRTSPSSFCSSPLT
jgi:hypothetical protein